MEPKEFFLKKLKKHFWNIILVMKIISILQILNLKLMSIYLSLEEVIKMMQKNLWFSY